MTTDDAMNLPLIDLSRTSAARSASFTFGSQNPDIAELNNKIYNAFAGTKSFPFERIIFQFWLPVVDDAGRVVLQSSGNPFAYASSYSPLPKIYRPLSMNYYYSTDGEGDKPPWIISDGPVTTAVGNHFPEVVLDLKVHQGSPLVDCALECDLTCCVMIPVFYHGSSGVVECSMKHRGLLLQIFNEMKHELEKQGLSIYHAQGIWPYKTITTGDLEPAKTEIKNGLKMACESHDLTLAQVWISYIPIEQTFFVKPFMVKLMSECSHDNHPIKDFYEKFDVITDEGLAWKTLLGHRSHMGRTIYGLSDNKGVLSLISANANVKCTCFVICLRSTHTGEVDYAFEFFWPSNPHPLTLSENLVLTLRKYLPSFSYASGEQLGDVKSIVNVDFLSFLNTRTSVGVKRKSISAYKETIINNLDDNDDDLAILATYRYESSLFYLPSSSTYEVVMQKLNQEFELDSPG